MALIDDLKRETDEIIKGGWTRRRGQKVPEPKDLRLTNDSVDLDATFLYADLADSTELVLMKQDIAAEVMRAYLRGATRIIRSCGGEIRSFDGDRVMGVFIEGAKNTSAAKAGLQINYFFTQILKPAFASFYPTRFPSQFDLRQTVGIDTSDVMVVRGGLRDDNDLVWVGRAPNIAAKLSAIRESGYSTYITSHSFGFLLDEGKYGGVPRQLMWEQRSWAAGSGYGVPTVYRSNWTWKP